MRFAHLFKPGRIGSLEIRNRIISSPMERNYCTVDGRITQRYIDYLEARARGGVGAMYTEATYVDARGRAGVFQMGLHSDDMIPGLQRLTAVVHRHGVRIGPELNFGGRVANPAISGFRPLAPSVVPYTGRWSSIPTALEKEDLAWLVGRYQAAARRAVEAGCDFVGLHGAHGYLLSEFLSPYCNKRDDEYGGDLQGRMRFPLEVVAAVRKAIGGDVPIVYRISGSEYIEGGTTIDDVCAAAPYLQAAGVDLLDISAGMYETSWWIVQPMEVKQGILAPLSSRVRSNVTIPISVAGRINDPSVAEDILATGASDFVTMGRALHADPEFPNKAREGRLDDISVCIACNQGCNDYQMRGEPTICLVNTATGREREYAIQPAKASLRIAVVGAGPAGLECARILALRGHEVTVFDRSDEPGGQLLLSRHVPTREEIAGHIPWLISSAMKAGVRLELGMNVTADMLIQMHADAIVLATGAEPGIPGIPGAIDSPIVSPYEVLRRPLSGIKRALIIGGGIRGVGVARVLAQKGTDVILAEATNELVTDIAVRSRKFQVEDLSARKNVIVHLGTTVERLGESHAVFDDGKSVWEVSDIDVVLPVRPLVPVLDLSDELFARSDIPAIFSVGDCVQPRTALEAIHDAAALGHRI